MSETASHEESHDLLGRGRNLRASGYPASSLELFLRAARLAPDNGEIRAELQRTREKIRELWRVVDACDQDLARTATHAETLLKLAEVLTGLGREEEALAAVRQAATIAPDDVEALFMLGHHLNNGGRYEEAIAVFDRLIAAAPDWSAGWTCKGMVLCNLRRHAHALPALYRAVTLNPNDVGGWAMTVLALSALGRTKEAEAASKREQAARDLRSHDDEDMD